FGREVVRNRSSVHSERRRDCRSTQRQCGDEKERQKSNRPISPSREERDRAIPEGLLDDPKPGRLVKQGCARMGGRIGIPPAAIEWRLEDRRGGSYGRGRRGPAAHQSAPRKYATVRVSPSSNPIPGWNPMSLRARSIEACECFTSPGR